MHFILHQGMVEKILAYSLLNYLTKEYDSDRITIYLIEEPENSLHRSMQVAIKAIV